MPGDTRRRGRLLGQVPRGALPIQLRDPHQLPRAARHIQQAQRHQEERAGSRQETHKDRSGQGGSEVFPSDLVLKFF